MLTTYAVQLNNSCIIPEPQQNLQGGPRCRLHQYQLRRSWLQQRRQVWRTSLPVVVHLPQPPQLPLPQPLLLPRPLACVHRTVTWQQPSNWWEVPRGCQNCSIITPRSGRL